MVDPNKTVGSFVQILRSQAGTDPVARAWQCAAPVGSFVQIFFARLEMYEDELGFEPHQDQRAPAEVRMSRAGCACGWRRTIKSYASSGTNRRASGFVARRFGPSIQEGAGLRWSEPRRVVVSLKRGLATFRPCGSVPGCRTIQD